VSQNPPERAGQPSQNPPERAGQPSQNPPERAGQTSQNPPEEARPPGEDPRRRLGRRGEELAVEHLIRRGFRILARNYRTRWGELDIVAYDGRTIAFCEVKSRRLESRPLPAFASLHDRKQARVRRMALQWLSERAEREFARTLRFDAIGVTLDARGNLIALEHLEGAF
jgi:putative endonuclease